MTTDSVDQLAAAIADVRENMATKDGINQINNRLDGVNNRLACIDGRLDRIEGAVVNIETELLRPDEQVLGNALKG